MSTPRATKLALDSTDGVPSAWTFARLADVLAPLVIVAVALPMRLANIGSYSGKGDEGIRAEVLSGGSLGSRIRAARLHRDPYLAIVGDEELADGTVSVLVPQCGQRARIGHEQFVRRVLADVRGRVLGPSALP